MERELFVGAIHIQEPIPLEQAADVRGIGTRILENHSWVGVLPEERPEAKRQPVRQQDGLVSARSREVQGVTHRANLRRVVELPRKAVGSHAGVDDHEQTCQGGEGD